MLSAGRWRRNDCWESVVFILSVTLTIQSLLTQCCLFYVVGVEIDSDHFRDGRDGESCDFR